MQLVLQIFLNNILPIFLMILVGVWLGKAFRMDLNTLSKINFYVTVPAFAFTQLYSTDLSRDQLLVFFYAIIQVAVLALIADLTARVRGHGMGMRKAFANSVMIYNSGNIGIPLITLVFSSSGYIAAGENPALDLALATQTVILVVLSITTNTFGFYNSSSGEGTTREALGKMLRMPTIYAVPLALILKNFSFDLSEWFFWPALQMGSNALIALALLTLGIQLTQTRFRLASADVWIAVALRLVAGPIIAFVLIYLFGFTGIVARTLLISGSVPTAVNSALLAVENKNEPEFASQVVLFSTILCGATLVLVIWLSTRLFPL